MENPTFTFIFFLTHLNNLFTIQPKQISKPNHTKNVQTPGKFDHFL